MVQRKVHVGQRLRLHPLRGVHHQQRAFAGRQRTGNFIIEVHMAGGVDKVQLVMFAVFRRVGQAHGLGLDGDAAFALKLHFVQILLASFTVADHLGDFKNAVGEGGLAVVNVGDDAKIADMFLLGHDVPSRKRAPAHGTAGSPVKIALAEDDSEKREKSPCAAHGLSRPFRQKEKTREPPRTGLRQSPGSPQRRPQKKADGTPPALPLRRTGHHAVRRGDTKHISAQFPAASRPP